MPSYSGRKKRSFCAMKDRVQLCFAEAEQLDAWGGWKNQEENVLKEVWAYVQPYARHYAAVGWRVKRDAPDQVKALDPRCRRWGRVYKILLRQDVKWKGVEAILWNKKRLKILTEPTQLPDEPEAYMSFLAMEFSQDKESKGELIV